VVLDHDGPTSKELVGGRVEQDVLTQPSVPDHANRDRRASVEVDRLAGLGDTGDQGQSPQQRRLWRAVSPTVFPAILVSRFQPPGKRSLKVTPRLRGYLVANPNDLAATEADLRRYLPCCCSGTDATLIDPAVSIGLVADAQLPADLAEALYWATPPTCWSGRGDRTSSLKRGLGLTTVTVAALSFRTRIRRHLLAAPPRSVEKLEGRVPEPAIRLAGLCKSFGPIQAVAGIDLEIADGEFFSLLGPSGSGKTTVLRLIAGFELPSAGTVTLAGRDVSRLPPYDRDVNTVFQDYALFPHMSVQQNVEYGLRVRGVPRVQRSQRAREALRTVRLDGFGDRRPNALSGGQRQRVALARALVNRPAVLLLDEPLGALDLKLREEMQVELKAIQRDVGITFVFVTHDQQEALTMSDRIAVFNHGRIEQVGEPAEVYERPGTPFVAGFVGTSNLLAGPTAQAVLGREGVYSVRPEKIRLDGPPPSADEIGAAGQIVEVVYAGAVTRFVVDLDAGARIVAIQQNQHTSSGDVAGLRGKPVRLAWRAEHVIAVPANPR
jgi:putative spermidine/putrescine transport system ATP-binding protein